MASLKREKKFENLFVRIPLYTQEAIEIIRHGHKIFIEDDPKNLKNEITNENYVEARSKVAFIDTCYFVKMFESYLKILATLGYDWSDAYDAYFLKLEENHHRQETNY